MLAQGEGPCVCPEQAKLPRPAACLACPVMRSATWSRQKPDPALRARLGTPCHACSTQFGDVHGRSVDGQLACQPVTAINQPAIPGTCTRDASSVMSLIHSPGPAGRSPRARPLETSIESKHPSHSTVETHRPPAARGNGHRGLPNRGVGTVESRRHAFCPETCCLAGFKPASSGVLLRTSGLLDCPWRCDCQSQGLSLANLQNIVCSVR